MIDSRAIRGIQFAQLDAGAGVHCRGLEGMGTTLARFSRAARSTAPALLASSSAWYSGLTGGYHIGNRFGCDSGGLGASAARWKMARVLRIASRAWWQPLHVPPGFANRRPHVGASDRALTGDAPAPCTGLSMLMRLHTGPLTVVSNLLHSHGLGAPRASTGGAHTR